MENQNQELKKFPKPTNQKSVYNSFARLYESLMNDDIKVDKAETAVQALAGMNRAFALEIKYAELKDKADIRTIELKNFEENE